MNTLKLLIVAGISLALSACDSRQSDLPYPSSVVKIIVPYQPGGASDTIARLLAEELRSDLGQPFLIENKPGGFGILAIEKIATAEPDGYTLMLGNVTTNGITPILYADKFSVDYQTAITPVARVASLPNLLVTTTSGFEPETLAEVIEYARQNPGKVRYGSAGVGSFSHLDLLSLAQAADIDMIHVPTSGGAAQALNDLGNGDIQLAFMNVSTGAAMVTAGRIRAIAVAADQRLPQFPDVPTMAEIGFPEVGTQQWFALFASSQTPAEVLQTVRNSVIKSVRSESLLEAFELNYFRPDENSTQDALANWLTSELDKWKKTLTSAGLYESS